MASSLLHSLPVSNSSISESTSLPSPRSAKGCFQNDGDQLQLRWKTLPFGQTDRFHPGMNARRKGSEKHTTRKEEHGGRQFRFHNRHFSTSLPFVHENKRKKQRSMSLSAQPSNGKRDAAPIQPKTIRFIPSDGLPHAKRRRINAACQTCRKRKTRCSGERPVCQTCTHGGHPCGGYSTPVSQKEKSLPVARRGDEDDYVSRRPMSDAAPEDQGQALHERFSRSPLSGRSSDSGSASPFTARKLPHLKKQDSDVSEAQSLNSNGTGHSGSFRNRVPYFRYFGPTAIVPGFKQMVVSMRGPRLSDSYHGDSPAINSGSHFPPGFRKTPSITGSDSRGSVEIPFYDANDPAPVSSLITQLCELFFTHLGCNYPFLQRDRFLRDLEEKRVDAILVDAVCAHGARFSNHRLLTAPNDQSVEVDANGEVQRAFRGHPFSQRAMSAVIDTFAYPTVAVVQATLLLAYDEFGSNHDSGLWMYLGTSIRMAQDIGMHKLEGLSLEGRVGPTPKTAKRGSAGSNEEFEREETQRELTRREEELLEKDMMSQNQHEIVTIEERRANERERIDTFYAVFFLDRVVSSGTGRPVTLRDKDIEISFPFRSDDESVDDWPAPFPPLIRIIHLYGRAADVLNGIKDIQQVTPDKLKRLAGMEKDLTNIYSGLSPKLHFNAVNFQHYVKAEQGTNFILLHFWFHTLIVLLHQPTLLHSFGGRIQQLFPDSRELSMSSAKTIADILAFAELIDAKSFIGNPFTTQPIYVAACAFLAEIAHYSSQPPSRGETPFDNDQLKTEQGIFRAKMDKNGSAKNTLLASAANQNYQRCYKALKAITAVWAGGRYIITALDQKSKGIMDPLLYTHEDVESAIEAPRSVPVFSAPGWRRSLGHPHSQRPRQGSSNSKAEAWSPTAFGFSLSGGFDDPNPNLSLLYSTPQPQPTAVAPSAEHLHPIPEQQTAAYTSNPQSHNGPSGLSGNAAMFPPPSYPQHPAMDRLSDADLLLGLQSPAASSSVSNRPAQLDPTTPFQQHQVLPSALQPSSDPLNPNVTNNFLDPSLNNPFDMSTPFSDMMMIESADIDVVNTGLQSGFSFPSGDMLPWLEYLPQDVLSYFNDPNGAGDNQQQQRQPPGPGHEQTGSATGNGTGGPAGAPPSM